MISTEIIKKISLLIVIFILIIFVHPNFVNLINALPPPPTEFYGVVRTYNTNVSPGASIRAYDSSGTLCGTFTVINNGFFGSLTCAGDDPETIVDEGASAGENISFRYMGSYTTVMGNNTWGYGIFQYVNLTHPVVYCGDYFCDYWYENSLNCPIDCPPANGSTNVTFNGTNITGGDGGGDGAGTSGEGEDGGSLGVLQQYNLNYSGLNATGFDSLGFTCQEEWLCGNWSQCRINGFQNRTCSDRNNCGTYEDRPNEIQKCYYTPTCFDGVRNGLEEGIDCGGLCAPCITCFDGIQNCHDGQCEEGTDCGGPCPQCPTCFDGIQNCHDGQCEEGTDCGGPCERICPAIQLALPEFLCKKEFNPFSNQSLFFFIIVLIVILTHIIYSKNKIDDIKRKKKLSDINRAKNIFSIKRRLYLFISIIVMISIILYLYYYFFIMCSTDYKFLWILLLILFLSPLIIHQVIRYLEYSEKKSLKKLNSLLDNHYKQIENLIRIENENLYEMEESISRELYRLMEKPEYKNNEVSYEKEILKNIYKELVLLFSKYKERENPIKNEKLLCDDIYKLLEDEKYKEFIQKDNRLQGIITKLKIIYKQYEEKQKLYDEINKIESSKQELNINIHPSKKEKKIEK